MHTVKMYDNITGELIYEKDHLELIMAIADYSDHKIFSMLGFKAVLISDLKLSS